MQVEAEGQITLFQVSSPITVVCQPCACSCSTQLSSVIAPELKFDATLMKVGSEPVDRFACLLGRAAATPERDS